jgi:hypothetical protein
MPDPATAAAPAGERDLAIVRTALHRAADLLERAQLDLDRLEVNEALDLVFVALHGLADLT